MRTKFAFIVAHASEHASRFMCKVIGVTRSCYYAWQRMAPRRAERAAWRDGLGAEIEAIFLQSKRRYGAPRVPLNQGAELKDRGFRVSKRTVARLMPSRPICWSASSTLPCQTGVAGRHFVHSDERRLALPRCGQGPGHDGDRRLADVRTPEEHFVRRHAQDGDPEPAATRRADPLLESRHPIRLWRLPQTVQTSRHQGLHELKGELPRKYTDGELLQFPQKRACTSNPVRHTA